MNYQSMALRARELSNQVFPENAVEIAFEETDAYVDGSITFNAEISIVEVEQVYQIYIVSVSPGVWRHPDGSGTPPDMELVEVKEPFPVFEDAVVEVLTMLLRNKLEDFLVAEAEAEAEADYAGYDYDKEGTLY